MKRYTLLILAALLLGRAHAYDRARYNISKPVCVLTFLQAATGTHSVSPSLAAYISEHMPVDDSAHFHRLVSEFAAINLEYSYVFPAYPERRQYPHTTLHLVSIAAVQSQTLDEFFLRIVGILPNEQWLRLKRIFTEAAPIYDRMIFRPFEKNISRDVAELEKFNDKTDMVFGKLKTFYGSTWGDDIPFTVSIYPIPGDQGTTTATPHSNSVVLAILTGNTDFAGSASVAMHEMCHVLYQEQPLALQQQTDACFMANTSAYRQYAYSYIDEGLATACGNGWAYKQLAGKMDTGSWYNDEYIDGYAHALYPMVEQYINAGKTIDEAFINKAVALFGQKFPSAIYSYPILMNRMNLYTDADNNEQYGQVTNVLNHYFQISSCAGAYPINDPQALDMISQTTNTQLFIVHTNHQKNYDALKTKFPQMSKMDPAKEGIISFLDEKKRPVIVVNVNGISRLDAGIRQLAAAKTLDTKTMFMPLVEKR